MPAASLWQDIQALVNGKNRSMHHNAIVQKVYEYRYYVAATTALVLIFIRMYRNALARNSSDSVAIDFAALAEHLIATIPTAEYLRTRYPIPQECDKDRVLHECWNLLSQKNNTIFFYKKSHGYYEFTNFAEGYPITMDEYDDDGNKDPQPVVWPTTEHYFQAQKFPYSRVSRDEYRQMTTPRLAQEFAQQGAQKRLVDENWNKESVFIPAMYRGLVAKFTQHPKLYKLLLNTDNKILVEDTALSTGWNDERWGAGKDYRGANYLGRLLMYIRDESRQYQNQVGIADQLGIARSTIKH